MDNVTRLVALKRTIMKHSGRKNGKNVHCIMPDEPSESATNWLESLKRDAKHDSIPYIDDEDIELSDIIGVSVSFSSDLITETSDREIECYDNHDAQENSNKLFASIFRKSKRKKSLNEAHDIRNK